MKLGNVTYTAKQGRALAYVRVDGIMATIGLEQKWMNRGMDLIFMGAALEQVLPEVRIPANLEIGRGPLVARGCSDHPAVIAIWRNLVEKSKNGELTNE